MNKLTKDLVYLLVITVLIIIILLQRSCGKSNNLRNKVLISKNEIIRDTIYKEINTVKTKKITVFKKDTTFLPGDTVFVASENYDTLKTQYLNLTSAYKIRNIYKDSVEVDQFGHIVVIDTVQYNQLKERIYVHNYKIPLITNTLVAKERNQVYIGAGLSVSTQVALSNVNAGLLYKSKKDHIYGLHAGVDSNVKPFVGVSSYWKISFRK
jgi:hypothetical protein